MTCRCVLGPQACCLGSYCAYLPGRIVSGMPVKVPATLPPAVPTWPFTWENKRNRAACVLAGPFPWGPSLHQQVGVTGEDWGRLLLLKKFGKYWPGRWPRPWGLRIPLGTVPSKQQRPYIGTHKALTKTDKMAAKSLWLPIPTFCIPEVQCLKPQFPKLGSPNFCLFHLSNSWRLEERSPDQESEEWVSPPRNSLFFWQIDWPLWALVFLSMKWAW